MGNEDPIAAVRRSLNGRGSGRVAVLITMAAFLALGIYARYLPLIVPFGIATLAAAWSVARAARDRRLARRMRRASVPRQEEQARSRVRRDEP